MNTAKDNFGEMWRKACENAELPPDESLWNLVLDRLSNSKWQQALEEGKIPPSQELWNEITNQLDAIKWQRTVEDADLKPKKDLWASISDELDASEWSEKFEGEVKEPNAGLWASISDELDNSEWSEKLENESIGPDSGLWASICNGLDDSEWADKLDGESLTPKTDLWAAISENLETSEWAEKMDAATMTPNPSLWSQIEAELPPESKSKVIVFPWWKSLAAAVTLIAVSTLGIRSLTEENTLEPSEHTPTVVKQNATRAIPQAAPMSVPVVEPIMQQHDVVEAVASVQNTNVTIATVPTEKATNPIHLANAVANGNDAEPPIMDNSATLLAQNDATPSFKENVLPVQKVETANLRDVVIYSKYSLQYSDEQKARANAYYAALDNLEKLEKNSKGKKYYAGLNVNSTTHDSKLTGGNASVLMATSKLPENSIYGMPMETSVNQSTKSSMSMRYGVEGGMFLSEKWVLETGLMYGNLATAATSEATSHYKINDVDGSFSVHSESYTTDYEYVYNSFSVPLKVGYVIGKKKLKMIVKSGINTEIVSGDEVNVGDHTYVGGAPDLRPYYFNGVIGNEITYQFDPKFNVGFEANYEFGFDKITESGLDSYGSPSAYNIGVKLKYIIN